MFFNKIQPAFTVLEMLIVMILLSLIVYIGVLMTEIVFSIRSQMIEKFNSYYHQRMSIEFFKQDVDVSKIVFVEGNNLYCIRTTKDTISYVFEKDNLIRSYSLRQDSLPLDMFNVTYYNGNQLVQSGVIDRIELVLGIQDSSLIISIRKQYDAYTLIQSLNYDECFKYNR